MSDAQKLLLSGLAIALAAFGPSLLPWLKAALTALAAKPTAPVAPQVVPPSVAALGPTLDGKTFAGAIEALAIVRNRLTATGCMSETAAAAVEAITHALVQGTDK